MLTSTIGGSAARQEYRDVFALGLCRFGVKTYLCFVLEQMSENLYHLYT